MNLIEMAVSIVVPVLMGSVGFIVKLQTALHNLESRLAVQESSSNAANTRVDRMETDICKKLDRLEEKLDKLISERS